MTIDADRAAEAVLQMMEGLGATWANGWVRRESGCLALVSGVVLPTLNGVLVASEQFDGALVASLLDEVASTGLPLCLQVRPACVREATGVCADRSMVLDEHTIPLMVLEETTGLADAAQVDGLVLRELAPSESSAHVAVAAAGFGAPPELFAQLATPSMMSAPGVRCIVGEVDGEAVTTGMGYSLGSHASIFSVATVPEHRGKGYGAAVTARLALDGFDGGAEWSWLQASPDGFPVYERLGYRTVEAWSCWVTDAEPDGSDEAI